jgi:hypothetical protein
MQPFGVLGFTVFLAFLGCSGRSRTPTEQADVATSVKSPVAASQTLESPSGRADEKAITDTDRDAILKLAERFKVAFLENDHVTTVGLLDPELVQAAGGPEKLIEILRLEEEKNKNARMAVHSLTIAAPERVYVGTKSRLAFLRTVLDVTFSEARVRSRSFQIAYSPLGTDDWHLIDGTNLTLDQFQVIFPGLPNSVKLPTVEKELLE